MTRFAVPTISVCLLCIGASLNAAETGSLQQILAGGVPTSIEDLKALEARVQVVAARVMPATVSVLIGSAHGSGVIVSPKGLVLTAAHVSGKPGQEVTLRFPDGTFLAGKTLGALSHG